MNGAFTDPQTGGDTGGGAARTFIAKARPQWDELNRLLDTYKRRGPSGMTTDELSQLDRLYRLTTVHLAQLQTRAPQSPYVAHLNSLVARTHSVIYVSSRVGPARRVLRFLVTGFPRAVARTGRCQAVACAFFFIAAILAALPANVDPSAAYAFTMAGDFRLPGCTAEQLETALRSGRDWPFAMKFIFAAQLFVNNTTVGFNAFVSGVLAGIPTVFIMMLNGAILGSFTMMHHRQDIVAEVWAWLLPHGVPEIAAAILCGGAGLYIGAAILQPGFEARSARLKEAARTGMQVVLGCVPLLVAAAIIEAFLRQSELGATARLIFAAGAAVVLTVYLGAGFVLERAEARARERAEDVAAIRASSSL